MFWLHFPLTFFIFIFSEHGYYKLQPKYHYIFLKYRLELLIPIYNIMLKSLVKVSIYVSSVFFSTKIKYNFELIGM